MFKFFTKRWVSRKDYEEKVKTIQRLELMLMDDWEREVAELNDTRREPRGEEAWVIPFCIGELEKLNKKLTEYTPFNPELKKLTIEEVIYKLSLEMQIQNHVLMTALRHLMGETEK